MQSIVHNANPSVCLVEGNEIVFLLQDNQRLKFSTHPQAQIIAEAITVLSLNNENRMLAGLPHHEFVPFPAIAMFGTTPVFYKIPVTTELVRAVQNGTYPEFETRVHCFTPILPYKYEEMRSLLNRVEALRCLKVLKNFIGTYSKVCVSLLRR